MKDIMNFSHNYFKFNNEHYTTIRGMSAIKQYMVNQFVAVNIKREFNHFAKILKIEPGIIRDMSINFLKEDAEYPGFVINTKQDFIKLINSFRRFNKLQDENEIMTIIYLKKVR